MFRALYFRELRAGLIWEGTILVLCLCLAYLIGIFFINRGYPVADWAAGIYTFVLLLVNYLEFAAGERTFSSHFKSRQYLFLHTLPLRRSMIWLAIISGRLTAGLTIFPAQITFGAMLVSNFQDAGRGFLFLVCEVAVLRIFLFAAGTCGALLFGRAILVYLGGGLLLTLFCLQLLGYSSIGLENLNDRETPLAIGENLESDQGREAARQQTDWRAITSDYVAAASSLVIMVLAFTTLSRNLFCAGEWSSSRRIGRNILTTCSILTACLGWSIISKPLFITSQSTWLESIDYRTPVRSTESARQRVSRSGRYLALVDHYGGWGYFSRLRVLDTVTGRFAESWTGGGLLWAGWSAHDDTLLLAHIKGLWIDPNGAFLRHLALLRLSPAHHEIEVLTMEGFSAADPKTVNIDSYGSRGHILKIGLPGEERSWPLEGSTPRELTAPPMAATPSGLSAAAVLRRILPHPGGSSGEAWQGRLLLPAGNRVFISTPGDPAYFIAKSDQYSTAQIYQPKATGWKMLTERLPANPLLQRQDPVSVKLLTESILLNAPLFHASVFENLAAYSPDGGESGQVAVYDGSLEREVTIQACPQAVGVRRVRMLDGGVAPQIPIRVECKPEPSRPTPTTHYFLYRIGSGRLTEVLVVPQPGQELAYLDERTALWCSTAGWTVVRDGKTRRLWPPAD